MMRKIHILILMTVAMFWSLPGSAATVLHYTCDQGTPGQPINPGTEPAPGVPDLSGNGYDMWGWASADDNNSPLFSEAGDTWDGSGLSLVYSGGQDGYTTDATLNAWSPLEWTIEVAVRLDTVAGWNTLIGRDGATFGGSEADFYLQENGIDDHFRINFITAGQERVILDADFVVVPDQWYRLAVVSDGQTVTMYCDKLDGNGYQVVGTYTFSGVNNALAATDFVWTFGRGWYNGATDFVEGNLDDIKFSDVALPVNMLGFAPYAYDPNPTPLNVDGSVGDLVDSTAEVTLNFKAGRDPNEAISGNAVNPDIRAHHIWLSASGTDANLVYLDTVPQTSLTNPDVSYGPLALDQGSVYNWRVEEALDDGMGSYYGPGDPNNIRGPIWSFTTIAVTPSIISGPSDVVADAAGNATLTVVGSATAETYQWFKVGDPEDIELENVGIYSGTNTNTLQITGATLADEGKYYCIAYRGITPSAPSRQAQLWLSRLAGYWKFDGNMLDSVQEEVPGAPTHDGSIAENSTQTGPGDENYVGAGNGIEGDAMLFQNDGDFVAIDGSDFFNFFPQGFTASFWYKANEPLVGWRLPISKLDAGSAGWLFGTDHLLPAPQFTFIVENPWNRMDGDAEPDVGDGQWHMGTVTYDPDADLLRLFTDGDEDAQLTLDLSAAPLPTAPLSIGGRDTELSINGAMDEVRLYTYPLSPTEVAALYTEQRPDEYVCVIPDGSEFAQFDLNGDCRITLADFAEIAQQWMECQRYPEESCDWAL